MPFCQQCGAEVSGGFCGKCGAPAPGAAPPTASAQPAQGISDNAVCALCYLAGLITGILFLLLAPYNTNPRVKFHAWQSIFAHLALIVVGWGLGMLMFGMAMIGGAFFISIWPLIWICGFLLWLFLMWKAYQGENVELPLVGPLARKQAGF